MISIVAHHSYPSSWPVPIDAYVTCGRCTLRAVLESQPDPAGPCRRSAQWGRGPRAAPGHPSSPEWRWRADRASRRCPCRPSVSGHCSATLQRPVRPDRPSDLCDRTSQLGEETKCSHFSGVCWRTDSAGRTGKPRNSCAHNNKYL